MADPEPVPIPPDLLAAGRSPRGGWSAAQLARLGVPWPPPPGWKLAIAGRLVSRADAERFLALREGTAVGDGFL